MIDMHCHILPEVDDGSISIHETIEMAKIAYADGIREIINTSHFHSESDDVTGLELLKTAKMVNEALEKEGVGVRVHVGNELYWNEGLMKNLDSGGFYTLAKSDYVLVEFRPDKIPPDIEDVAYEFIIRGYRPIIAHIERYIQVVDDIEVVAKLIDSGFLIQMNSRPITLGTGGRVESFCREALERNMVHFVASDAHDRSIRTPSLAAAYEKVKAITGEEIAREIFLANPEKLLKNEDIDPFEIIGQKKGGLRRFFKRHKKQKGGVLV
ncbi:protein-tyrosine phosphatase [Peptoclostridium litorale DSM 5388]|uniref:protein-tyrosine-phosphatase n=1 Tax=Peptoclostridium litorale DSM 5388 TaxID=1121324 RepID=A0A069RCD5_PEPLI|nr:CpsB/CapC family capsule biosynthesis tyrosine phosphatase [Peptoclostridium litorale]KDR94671.1 tyrosine-protein phosphatase CpsB [Peptoclostridium litorale DSM 5388]SIO29967.1 protein-tyrosine phosphatase [Peptoclostridium litorale DSM 5388]